MEVQPGILPGSNPQNPAPVAGNPQPEADDDSWMTDAVKVKAYVTNLRNENKTRRQENQTLTGRLTEVETAHQGLVGKITQTFGVDPTTGKPIALTPEKQIEQLQMTLQEREEQLEAQTAEFEFMNSAVSLGFTDSKEQKLLKFLVSDHMEDKPDGYEMTEEDLADIVAQVNATRPKQGTGNPKATSFSQSIAPPPDGNQNGATTLKQFQEMGTIEKSQLYGSNPTLYNQLQAASEKK